MNDAIRRLLGARLSACSIALTIVAASLPATSCAPRMVNSEEPARLAPPRPIERRLRISAYTTHDGRRHAWPGTVEPAGQDSVLLVIAARPEAGLQSAQPGTRLMLPQTDIESITPSHGAVAGVVIIALLGIAVVATALAGGLSRSTH